VWHITTWQISHCNTCIQTKIARHLLVWYNTSAVYIKQSRSASDRVAHYNLSNLTLQHVYTNKNRSASARVVQYFNCVHITKIARHLLVWYNTSAVYIEQSRSASDRVAHYNLTNLTLQHVYTNKNRSASARVVQYFSCVHRKKIARHLLVWYNTSAVYIEQSRSASDRVAHYNLSNLTLQHVYTNKNRSASARVVQYFSCVHRTKIARHLIVWYITSHSASDRVAHHMRCYPTVCAFLMFFNCCLRKIRKTTPVQKAHNPSAKSTQPQCKKHTTPVQNAQKQPQCKMRKNHPSVFKHFQF
jgi:hypothetical protein